MGQKGATPGKWASISTFPVSLPAGGMLTFKQRGRPFSAGGLFTVQYSDDGGAWLDLSTLPPAEMWERQTLPLPAASSLQVRFNCGGPAECALDSVFIMTPGGGGASVTV